MVRADKNKRAAEHQFTKWYGGEVWSMNRRWYRCNFEDSQSSDDRKRSPHNLLYFLLNVLQRLVDELWKTMESSETYVKMCVATMNKCPPSIIGFLVYLKAPRLSPSTGVAFPPTSKDRICASETARAEVRSASPASASALASAAADDDAEFEAFLVGVRS